MKKGLMGLTGNWGKAGPSRKSSSRAMGSSGFTIGFTGGGVGIGGIMPMSSPVPSSRRWWVVDVCFTASDDNATLQFFTKLHNSSAAFRSQQHL